MLGRKPSTRGSNSRKYKAKLVNYVPFRIVSHISYRNHRLNYLFPSWEHEDKNLNFPREQSRNITLSEARLMLEKAAGRTYCITAVTKRVIRYNLGLKSGGKMSQWLIDKEAFKKFIGRNRGG
jgi:hypothetical protein